MKKTIVLIPIVLALAAACSPRFQFDLLGQEKIQEVVLVPSAAREKIAVIDVEGTISAVADRGLFAREGDILSRVYYRLEKAAADPLVKAVILRFDTPGGEVTASDILYNEVLRFKEKSRRPVVGLMMSVCASGGYYIASACDTIIAHPSTITGSIGVISIFPNVETLFDKVGVRMNVIKSGAMKDSGSPFRTMTDEEKKTFQAIIDEYYEDFLKAVAAGRTGRLSAEALRPLADGRIYTARQALDHKLIDEIGYFETARQKALSLASLRDARVIAYTYYPSTKTNIYASTLADSGFLERKNLEDLIPLLKTGFYYLWLPESSR
jgi:protease-4